MTPEEIDQILSDPDTLEPSSGFTSSIMDAVYRQASEPPRPQFLWFHIGLLLTSCVGIAASGAVLMFRFQHALMVQIALSAPAPSVAVDLCYAMAAVFAALGLARLPRLLARP